jgi:hypothetical protein
MDQLHASYGTLGTSTGSTSGLDGGKVPRLQVFRSTAGLFPLVSDSLCPQELCCQRISELLFDEDDKTKLLGFSLAQLYELRGVLGPLMVRVLRESTEGSTLSDVSDIPKLHHIALSA